MKKFISCLIAFMLVFSMASCGQEQPEPAPTQSEPAPTQSEPPSATDKLRSLCLEYGYYDEGGMYRIETHKDGRSFMIRYPVNSGEYFYFICEDEDISVVMMYEEGASKQRVMLFCYNGEFKGEIDTRSYCSDDPEIFIITENVSYSELNLFHAGVNLMMVGTALILAHYGMSMQDLGFINY